MMLKKICCLLTYFSLLFSVSFSAEADTCFDNIMGSFTSSTSGTVNVCGFNLNVVLNTGNSDTVENLKTARGTINGKEVVITTSASSFKASTSSDPFTITVDGVVQYSGTSQAVTLEDGISLLNVFNAINGRTLTQIESNRVTTTQITNVVSSRIQSVIRPRAQGSRSRNLLNNKNLGFQQIDLQEQSLVQQNFSLPPTGLNAGDVDLNSPSSTWGSVNNNWISSDNPLSAYDGTVSTLVGGVDYNLSDTMIAGVAGGFEFQDFDTTFNDGKLNSYGFSVIPYLAKSFMDGLFSIDALVGYTRIHSDSDRNQTLGSVEADFGANRAFAALNGIVYQDINAFSLSGRLGFLYSYEGTEKFTESDSTVVDRVDLHLVQLNVGTELRYIGEKAEPFFRVAYLNDIFQGEIIPDSSDDDEFYFEVGSSYFFDNENLISDFSISHRAGRQYQSVLGLQASVLYTF